MRRVPQSGCRVHFVGRQGSKGSPQPYSKTTRLSHKLMINILNWIEANPYRITGMRIGNFVRLLDYNWLINWRWSRDEEEDMAKKKTSSGPGKKQCPACKTFVGVRTHTCECGHTFRSKTKTGSGNSTPTSDVVATVLAAQELIKKCGGAKKAISLIKSLSKSPF